MGLVWHWKDSCMASNNHFSGDYKDHFRWTMWDTKEETWDMGIEIKKGGFAT